MKSEINFKEILKEEAKNIGIQLNENQLEKFELYKDLLIEWNEKINLTAITDEYQIIMKHFIDCLEIVKYIEEGTNIVDVGTGAGFPGLVIAIYFEGKVNITLLDALNKRLLFLEEVINTAGNEILKRQQILWNEYLLSHYSSQHFFQQPQHNISPLTLHCWIKHTENYWKIHNQGSCN